jgi:hypothetical protein
MKQHESNLNYKGKLTHAGLIPNVVGTLHLPASQLTCYYHKQGLNCGPYALGRFRLDFHQKAFYQRTSKHKYSS